ncbi:hypothetical protein [Leuconostoc mesenteroides]|nr:hypothetical protein [Leuconostoc mesenteroides]
MGNEGIRMLMGEEVNEGEVKCKTLRVSNLDREEVRREEFEKIVMRSG